MQTGTVPKTQHRKVKVCLLMQSPGPAMFVAFFFLILLSITGCRISLVCRKENKVTTRNLETAENPLR